MENNYQKIINTFQYETERAVKNYNKNFVKFIKKFAKENWQKISLEIPQNLIGLFGANKNNKIAAYIIPKDAFAFTDDIIQKTYLVLGKNGTFLLETITDIHGNITETHLNLADGFPDYLDRYFRELYLMKN